MLLAGPIPMFAGGTALSNEWRTANRDSANLAPNAATTKEAILQVYAARTYGWRGIVGVRTWIAAKPFNATSYTVYQVIGWRAQNGGSVLLVSTDIPDRYWFGNRPELISDLRGDDVDDVIKRVVDIIDLYPYSNTYRMYPGPNSNTFTAWVGRLIPELKLDLPPTAIGKDYLGDKLIAKAPSGTGFQFSVLGLLGLLAGVEEGIEINLAGLTFGIDPLDLALKLPAIGRIAPQPHAKN